MNFLKFDNEKKKLVTQLFGGLGNQMFQYAATRSLSLRNDVNLVIDNWSGFVRDYQYKRKYELSCFPLTVREASQTERIPFWADRIYNKIIKKSPKLISNNYYGVYLKEIKYEFLPEVYNYKIENSCWMSGYWQSPKYFSGIETLILQEFMPSTPAESHFINLGKKMRRVNSVALGLRLYEESPDPSTQAAQGRLKSIELINQIILEISKKIESCHFFIFCTHKSSILNQLRFPGDAFTYVTPSDGYHGTHQNLWLLTQCRHHIITNSSFYWWGAWLSRNNYMPNEQVVYSADNFINKDTVMPSWFIY